MISLLLVLLRRRDWNIFHPQGVVFQASVPRFLFSFFFPYFTPFGLISNFQKDQNKYFICKDRNILLTFNSKGPMFSFRKSCYNSKGRVLPHVSYWNESFPWDRNSKCPEVTGLPSVDTAAVHYVERLDGYLSHLTVLPAQSLVWAKTWRALI